MNILEVRNLTRRFSGLVAVGDVSFDVAAGSITALIGPNGAGKTTCFSMIAGSLAPSAGTILYDGQDVTGLAPEDLCARGMARTFQIMRPLSAMTALDRSLVGAGALPTTDATAAAARPDRPSHRALCRKRLTPTPRNLLPSSSNQHRRTTMLRMS